MREHLFIPGKNYIAIILLLICLAAGTPGATTASAADLNLTTAPGIHPILGGESLAKIGRDLALLHKEYESYLYSVNALADLQFKSNNRALKIAQGRVAIEAIAAGDPEALRTDLQGLFIQNAAAFGSLISGSLPIPALARLDQLATLKFARPAYFVTNVGLVTSQGDRAILSDVVRDELGIDGAGITIGTLSDSFNCLGGAAGNTASGDLPSNINVLDDNFCNSATDEGRAMMQLIMDVAPGADQAFHTANGGQAVFAQGILDLADAGCDVIVDDIIYLAEPMFQDGIIAQAVNTVVDAGIPYFTSASNAGRNTYESSFIPSGTPVELDGSPMGIAHDFDPGPGVDIYQRITIPGNTRFLLSFQWDSPHFSVSGFPGSPNDLNIFLIDVVAKTALAGSTVSNIGGDPVEVLVYTNTTDLPMDLDLLITKPGGPDPALMKYVIFSTAITINEYGTPGSTSFGHSNADGASSVAAAFYARTPQFGFNPALVEGFSSVGGVPILFDTAGNKLSEPDIRSKPNITAPDGTNTTFFGSYDYEGDGFPNFFGTSAAVAHAAAAAALVLAADPTMLPDDIYTVLETTALDMDNPYTPGFDNGFDFATGWGLIQADKAVDEALSQPPAKPGNSNPANGATEVPIEATLSWSDGGGSDSYDVYFGTDPTPGSGEFIGNQTTLSYTPANMQYSTTYYWRIDAKNDAGTTTGDVWRFTTEDEPLTPPLKTVNPSPANSAGDIPVNIGLSWVDGGGAASYDVYFGTDPTPDGGEFRGSQTAASYNPGALQYDTTYYWRIDAKNDAGTSTGDVWRFTTEEEPLSAPLKPVNPSPAAGANGIQTNANLNWTDGGGTASYDVYFGTDPTPDNGEFIGNQTFANYKPAALQYSTTYYWRIDAKNNAGTTTGDVWSFTTADEPLAAPLKVVNPSPADGNTDIAVITSLSWADGGGAVSYDVYFGTDTTPDEGEFIGNQISLSYSPAPLQYSTTYYWRIDARNAAGTATGDIWYFTTTAAPPPLPARPATLSPATGAAGISIDTEIRWTAGGNTDSFDIYLGTNPSPGSNEFKGNQVLTSYVPDALTYDTTYYWRIDSKNANGTATGDVWQFTTRPAPPEVTVTAEDARASEKDSDPGVFRIRRTGETNTDLTVFFSLSGQAENGVDYALIQTEQIIPAGASYLDITLTPIADTWEEPAERAILVLRVDKNYTRGFPSSAKITIDNYNKKSALTSDFVSRFYLFCLDRSPDPFGLKGWTAMLLSGEKTGRDLAYGFLLSPEFIDRKTTDVEYLTILYRTFFNREPDPAGLQGWLDALNNGVSRNDLLDGFIYAGEFEALCDEYGIKAYDGHIAKSQRQAVEAFVSRFYREVLERDPDPQGLKIWVDNLLNHIQTGVDIAYGFIFSSEFISRNTTNQQFLTILYTAFFNREPDPVGREVWLDELDNGRDRREVLDGFLYSREFEALSQSYGINPY